MSKKLKRLYNIDVPERIAGLYKHMDFYADNNNWDPENPEIDYKKMYHMEDMLNSNYKR